jgi:hypothetical protein
LRAFADKLANNLLDICEMLQDDYLQIIVDDLRRQRDGLDREIELVNGRRHSIDDVIGTLQSLRKRAEACAIQGSAEVQKA